MLCISYTLQDKMHSCSLVSQDPDFLQHDKQYFHKNNKNQYMH